MNKSTKILLAIVVGILIWIGIGQPKKFGSVSQSSEYFATSTKNGVVGTTALANGAILTTGPGTLGSIVITGANTGVINFYDATSTLTNSQTGTTTLVAIPASLAAGTYTLDVQFSRGLVYEVIGTAPTSTITWRK